MLPARAASVYPSTGDYSGDLLGDSRQVVVIESEDADAVQPASRKG
jgi:hypothetical protein